MDTPPALNTRSRRRNDTSADSSLNSASDSASDTVSPDKQKSIPGKPSKSDAAADQPESVPESAPDSEESASEVQKQIKPHDQPRAMGDKVDGSRDNDDGSSTEDASGKGNKNKVEEQEDKGDISSQLKTDTYEIDKEKGVKQDTSDSVEHKKKMEKDEVFGQSYQSHKLKDNNDHTFNKHVDNRKSPNIYVDQQQSKKIDRGSYNSPPNQIPEPVVQSPKENHCYDQQINTERTKAFKVADKNLPLSFDSSMTKIIVGVPVVLMLFMVTLYWCGCKTEVNSSMQDIDSRQEMYERLHFVLEKLRNEFPLQSDDTWHSISAATKAVIKTSHPEQPAILLLASPHAETLSCVAKKLAESVTEVYGSKSHATISRNSYPQTADANQIKFNLDQDMKSAFESGSKALVIENLHKFHGKSALMFHAYCDHENAPFRDVAIIFTVNVPSTVHLENKDEVEDALMKSWEEDLRYDSLTPLLSRIANNIVLVGKDKEC